MVNKFEKVLHYDWIENRRSFCFDMKVLKSLMTEVILDDYYQYSKSNIY